MTDFLGNPGLHNCGGRDRRDVSTGERRKEPEMFNQVKRTMLVGAACCGWMVALSALGVGCSERQLSAVNVDGGMGGSAGDQPVGWQTFPQLGAHKVDLLFAIDNTQGMASLQGKMVTALPAMIDAIQSTPNGAPDLHVAVVSSDTGIGSYDDPDHLCPFGGDFGGFKTAPGGSCGSSSLLPGQTFFQISNGAADYRGTLADAVGCVAALGEQGCGFAGPLKSIRWALDPLNTLKPNAGFLRPEAMLAVVMLSHKDDCSIPETSDLADPTQTLMSDPLGPYVHFRCNEFGHLCQINGVLTHPPRGSTANLQGCVSNESPNGLLTRVTDEVAFLESLKSDPTRIMVAAIAGPTTPYSIDMVQEAGAPEAHPQVHSSCQLTTGESAEPPVRIQQWVSAFGTRGMMLPICADSLTPAFQTIGQTIADRAGALCFKGPFSTSAGRTQPACRIADLFPGPPAGDAGQIIPNCLDATAGASCWTAVDNPARCAGGTKSLVINRATPAPASSYVGVNCDPCPPNVPEVLGCGPT